MKTCLWLALGLLTNYSIWLAMFVNGARIGMVKTISPLARNAIRKAHRMVPSGFCVADRGSIFQTIGAAPIDTGALQSSAMRFFNVAYEYQMKGRLAGKFKRGGRRIVQKFKLLSSGVVGSGLG